MGLCVWVTNVWLQATEVWRAQWLSLPSPKESCLMAWTQVTPGIVFGVLQSQTLSSQTFVITTSELSRFSACCLNKLLSFVITDWFSEDSRVSQVLSTGRVFTGWNLTVIAWERCLSSSPKKKLKRSKFLSLWWRKQDLPALRCLKVYHFRAREIT